jgi:hypothetical protein
MHIELLWLIPVIAFAAFLFLVAFLAQRKADLRPKERDLAEEVALFNAGKHAPRGHRMAAKTEGDPMQEMEKMGNFVSESLAGKRRPGQGAAGEAAGNRSEVDDLKDKLRSVFKEYDILVSENYSLRARVKQLMAHVQEGGGGEGQGGASLDSFLTRSVPTSKPTLQLYDDTRLINIATMKDEGAQDSANSAAG